MVVQCSDEVSLLCCPTALVRILGLAVINYDLREIISSTCVCFSSYTGASASAQPTGLLRGKQKVLTNVNEFYTFTDISADHEG